MKLTYTLEWFWPCDVNYWCVPVFHHQFCVNQMLCHCDEELRISILKEHMVHLGSWFQGESCRSVCTDRSLTWGRASRKFPAVIVLNNSTRQGPKRGGSWGQTLSSPKVLQVPTSSSFPKFPISPSSYKSVSRLIHWSARILDWTFLWMTQSSSQEWNLLHRNHWETSHIQIHEQDLIRHF